MDINPSWIDDWRDSLHIERIELIWLWSCWDSSEAKTAISWWSWIQFPSSSCLFWSLIWVEELLTHTKNTIKSEIESIQCTIARRDEMTTIIKMFSFNYHDDRLRQMRRRRNGKTNEMDRIIFSVPIYLNNSSFYFEIAVVVLLPVVLLRHVNHSRYSFQWHCSNRSKKSTLT